ncbi:MAG: hypothetical protein ACR2N3_11410 [Pyrinomonadaceae bacterium]
MKIILTILFCAICVSAQRISSQYTNLGESVCKVTNTDIEYSLRRCPGIAGYKIMVADADTRESVAVVSPGGKAYSLNFDSGGYFCYVGEKAEWRMKRQKDKSVPIALIIRFYVQEDNEHPKNQPAYLMVIKPAPDKICGVDKINPVINQNIKARQIADEAAGKSCKFENFEN